MAMDYDDYKSSYRFSDHYNVRGPEIICLINMRVSIKCVCLKDCSWHTSIHHYNTLFALTFSHRNTFGLTKRHLTFGHAITSSLFKFKSNTFTIFFI